MGCVCDLGCDDFTTQTNGYLVCGNGTISRRAYKDDIHYVDEKERAALARQALEIQLAHYRYKAEPEKSSGHLGFIIDDQPDPSPAVHADRTHVDEYGYTSMLLATVQEQQAQIAELKSRLESLERSSQCPQSGRGHRSNSAPSGR
jgi:hypothetical protein